MDYQDQGSKEPSLDKLASDMDAAERELYALRSRLADVQAQANKAEAHYRNCQSAWKKAIEKTASRHGMAKSLSINI